MSANGRKDDHVTRCSLCGYRYRVDQAERACRDCPMSGNCDMVKCPNCGYETPSAEINGRQ